MPLFTRISLLAARPAAGAIAKGTVLARHESDFRAGSEEPLSHEDLVRLLSQRSESQPQSREGAIATYLSSGERAEEAIKRLGGAFAEGALGLTERKLG